jgi:hypothetical protein
VKIPVILIGLILLGVVFEAFDVLDLSKIDLFLLYNREMNPSSYVYYSDEHITYISLSCIIYWLLGKIPSLQHIKPLVFAFIIIEAMDFVDFWLTDNTAWFYFHGWPITFNIIKVFVFMLVLTYERYRTIAASGK